MLDYFCKRRMCVSQSLLRVDLHTSKGGKAGTELQSSENTELILLEDQTIFRITGH